MSDLADFLLARIAEDEAWAHTDADAFADIGAVPAPGASHPARVLAECEAKRSLIYETGQMLSFVENMLLRPFALVHADHPDFREEWRP